MYMCVAYVASVRPAVAPHGNASRIVEVFTPVFERQESSRHVDSIQVQRRDQHPRCVAGVRRAAADYKTVSVLYNSKLEYDIV